MAKLVIKEGPKVVVVHLPHEKRLRHRGGSTVVERRVPYRPEMEHPNENVVLLNVRHDESELTRAGTALSHPMVEG